MKIKIHLTNGEIIEINDVDKERLNNGINNSHEYHSALDFDKFIVFVKDIMYIEFEE